MLLNAIGMGAIIAIATYVLSHRCFEEKNEVTLGRILMYAVAPGVAAYFAPRLVPFFAILAAAIIIILMSQVTMWWDSEGSTFKEFIGYALIQIFLAIIAEEAATKGCDMVVVGWAQGVIKAIPVFFLILALGFAVWDILVFRDYLENSNELKPQKYLDTANDAADEELCYKYQTALRRRWESYDKISANCHSAAGSSSAGR